MGKKDVTWEVFFSDDSRYADIINAFGCAGKQVVRTEDLIEVNTRSILHAPQRFLDKIFGKKKIKYQRIRDSLRRVAFGMNFMLIGIESQESINYKWPLACIEYDVAEYEKQARKIKKEVRKMKDANAGEYLYGFTKNMKLNATVTFLIYSGEEKWDAPESLWDMLKLENIPEGLKHMVMNYKPYVIDVRHMPSTDMLKTDVKQVFDFIRCCDDKDKVIELVERNEEYRRLDTDAFDVIAGYTSSMELDKIKEDSRVEEGNYDMCKAIKELIEDGRSEGEKRQLIKLVCRKMAKGKIVSEIAEDLDEDINEIDKIYKAALKYAPNYDVEKILGEVLDTVLK